MYSFPTTRLPVEVLDNIIDLAIDVGTLTIKEVTLVSPRWKMRYQATLFNSVTLDPFDAEIPDLEKRAHLAPWIKVVRVAHRSRSSTPPDYERDIMEPFTKFLSHASKVECMVFLDERIEWRWISPNTIDAFRAVFERPSFRSLEISIQTSLPWWMLVHGASVASDLTIHCVGTIIPPEYLDLVSYRCSLTRLVLFGNDSVKWQMAEFRLFHPYLATGLLQKVIHLAIQYLEVDEEQGRSIVPHATMLVGSLGPQLEELELVAKSASRIAPPSYISPLEISILSSLQRLSIHLVGCSTTTTNTLASAIEFMNSVFSGLLPRCQVKSFSLRVDDWRESYAEASNYQTGYSNLLSCMPHRRLSYRENWPLLTSSHVLVNIASNEFTESFSDDQQIPDEPGLEFTSCLQVNILKAHHQQIGSNIVDLTS